MDTLEIKRKNLPHWRSEGVIYFVTWRLHRHQEPLYPEERSLICQSLSHFDGERYLLGAYVVMDDHVHLMVCPLPQNELEEILRGWRSYTANQLQRVHNRIGEVWQTEPYDHILRNTKEARQKANYIHDNPFRRWPELREYEFMGCGLLDWN
jgi:REP element-mobilizing transposase RayT